MPRYFESYVEAVKKRQKAELWKDTAILVFIALCFIAIGFAILYLLNNKLSSSGTIVQKLPVDSQGQVITDREKIPVEVAALPGGQYLKYKKVPVLMYHYIRELPGDDDPLGQTLSVSPAKFDEQMAQLKEAGYESIGLNDLYENNIPSKPIIITFDDGYDDAYTQAYPVLQKYGFKGVFYIVVNFVEKDLYLTWDQILQMQQGGMVFGSHTMNHAQLSSQYLSDTRKEYELTQSKSILEQKLGVAVNDFCYPGGQATTKTVDEVYSAGYKTATSTRMGIVQRGNYWLWLPRLRVKDSTNLEYLISQY